jgi:AbrB family looped-hinge helix DNA binding protein
MKEIIIKTTSKGQITLPKAVRDQLGVSVATYLSTSIQDGKIILVPVKLEPNYRSFSKTEINEFLKEDRINKSDAEYFEKLLNKE